VPFGVGRGTVVFTRNQKWKRPNAHKHGVFAATAILPGEDEREFEELHSALVEEWLPAGATEEDAVLSIAKSVWRKRRVQRFLEVQLMNNRLDPNHPSYVESLGLIGMADAMKLLPGTGFRDYASSYLRADTIEYLERKVQRSKFTSTLAWEEAVIAEINSLRRQNIEIGPVAAQIIRLNESAATVSGNLFKQELALDERLDAMIDRAVKRLIQTKAMKQMLRQAGTERADDRPRKIAAKKSSNE
jgi:hypothetical protein